MDFKPIREFQDRSITWLLGSVDHMVALLEIVVPEIAKTLDKRSLEPIESTLVPENLRKVEEDVVYQGRLNSQEGEIAFVVLVAHQSTKDRWMPFRFLRAMVALWEKDRRLSENGGKLAKEWHLRPIVPILIHTGEKPWDYPSFSELIAGHALFKAYIPEFATAELDLAFVKSDQLLSVKRPLAYLLRLFSAQYQSDGFDEILVESLQGLKDLAENSSDLTALVWFCIQFAFHRRPESEWVKMAALCSRYVNRKEGQAMKQTLGESMADRIRREGREQGFAEGVETGSSEGRAEGLQAALKSTLSSLLVVKFPKRSEQEIRAAIDGVAEVKKLESLVTRVLTTTTWEEFWSE